MVQVQLQVKNTFRSKFSLSLVSWIWFSPSPGTACSRNSGDRCPPFFRLACRPPPHPLCLVAHPWVTSHLHCTDCVDDGSPIPLLVFQLHLKWHPHACLKINKSDSYWVLCCWWKSRVLMTLGVPLWLDIYLARMPHRVHCTTCEPHYLYAGCPWWFYAAVLQQAERHVSWSSLWKEKITFRNCVRLSP